MSKPDHPGVIAPPPLLVLGVLALALAVEFGVVRLSTGLPPGFRYVTAAVLGAAAFALLSLAVLGQHRADTRPEPWKPTTAIVRTGVYAFTRNPMYLGMTLAYVALALAFDSGVALLLALPLVALLEIGVIRREERYLEGKFGEPYREYRSAVRRWL